MADEDYVELARELLDKMKTFIGASEPGEVLIPLHNAYTVVKRTVDAADPDSEISRSRRRLEDAQCRMDEIEERQRRAREQGEEQKAAREDRQREHEQYQQGRAGWTDLDRNVKKGRILTAVASDALILGQIIERIERAYPSIHVYDSDVRPLMNAMLAAGELERAKEARGPNCTITEKGGWRWRWRRSRGVMSPELRDLEQRLKGA